MEDMQLRGLALTTQRSYTHYVADFAKFYNTSPEHLDLEAIRQYELHLLHEKKLSPETINTFVSAVQFLYSFSLPLALAASAIAQSGCLTTLEMPWGKECFPRVRRGYKLPLVLSPQEVSQFFESVPSLKYRAALMTCYGAGLRISEAVSLKASDIDSKRMLIRVEEGKGRKDRDSMLSPRLLAVLRCYCRAFFRAVKPEQYLFPSWRNGRHMNSGALSLACREASQRCGLHKRITAHTLRH
jgi:integrase/recombinase XerD